MRWRTVIEVAVISIVIYVALGAPGLPVGLLQSTTPIEKNVPVARAKTESLVYPDKGLRCSRHDVDVHLLSSSPLVLYLDGFMSDCEAQHFIDIRYADLREHR